MQTRTFQELVEHMLYMINFGTPIKELPKDLLIEFGNRYLHEVHTITKEDIRKEADRIFNYRY